MNIKYNNIQSMSIVLIINIVKLLSIVCQNYLVLKEAVNNK